MQDVSKNKLEVRDIFCRPDLANTKTLDELDRKVPDLREQISIVANTARVQFNHCTLSDTSQVQPGQSCNNTFSETCASNSSCMIESAETMFAWNEWKCLEWQCLFNGTYNCDSADYWTENFAGITSSDFQ